MVKGAWSAHGHVEDWPTNVRVEEKYLLYKITYCTMNIVYIPWRSWSFASYWGFNSGSWLVLGHQFRVDDEVVLCSVRCKTRVRWRGQIANRVWGSANYEQNFLLSSFLVWLSPIFVIHRRLTGLCWWRARSTVPNLSLIEKDLVLSQAGIESSASSSSSLILLHSRKRPWLRRFFNNA